MKAKTQSTKKQPAKLPKKAPRKFQPQARLTKGSPSSVSPKARPDAPTTNARPHISKKATIESLVRREQGAAITELMTVDRLAGAQCPCSADRTAQGRPRDHT